MAAFSDDHVGPAPLEPPPEPPAEPEPPIDPTDPSEPEPEPPPEAEGPIFDVEAFVKALPEGVRLCPVCLGIGAAVDQPPYDPTAHLCPTCQGWGELQLPSNVGGQQRRKCNDCQGYGWRPNNPDEPPALPAGPEMFAQDVPPVDVHGRSPDDPEFDWSRIVVQPAAGEPDTAAEPAAVPH